MEFLSTQKADSFQYELRRGVSHMWPISFCCRAEIRISTLFFESTYYLWLKLHYDCSEMFHVWSQTCVFIRRFTRFLAKWAVPEAWRSVRQPEGQISARDWTRRDSREPASRIPVAGTCTHGYARSVWKLVNKSKPWRDSQFTISAAY